MKKYQQNSSVDVRNPKRLFQVERDVNSEVTYHQIKEKKTMTKYDWNEM